jgi:predicted adenylyl cyclase CyaB
MKQSLQEVELRALITPAQKSAIIKSLKKMGANAKKTTSLTDTYFCPTAVRSFKQTEMHKVGSYSLRIRQSGKVGPVELNTKVITRTGDHTAWDEFEVMVSEPSQLKAILKTLGFKPFITIHKSRQSFTLGACAVELETIKGFGTAIEVELRVPRPQADAAKQRIRKLLTLLGISEKQIVKKSVTNLIMKKLSNF